MWLQKFWSVLSVRVRAEDAQVPGAICSAPRKPSHGYRAAPSVMDRGPGCEHSTHKLTQEVKWQKAMNQRTDETELRLQEHGGLKERQEG